MGAQLALLQVLAVPFVIILVHSRSMELHAAIANIINTTLALLVIIAPILAVLVNQIQYVLLVLLDLV